MREKFGHRDIKSRGAYIESCEANIRFGFCQPLYLKDLFSDCFLPLERLVFREIAMKTHAARCWLLTKPAPRPPPSQRDAFPARVAWYRVLHCRGWMRSLRVRGDERRGVGDELDAARAPQEGDLSGVSGARPEGASLYRAVDAPRRAGFCARGPRGAHA